MHIKETSLLSAFLPEAAVLALLVCHRHNYGSAKNEKQF